MAEQYKLLIIDDDLGICETLQDILEDRGYLCTIACSGAEAMTKIESTSFDAVFCDLKLPDIIGIDLMDNMRQAGCDAVYFMITGDAAVDNAIQSLKKGAADFFIKPLNIEKLQHSLNYALEMEKTKKSLNESRERLALSCETNMVSNNILKLAMSDASLEDILQKSIDLIVNISWGSVVSKGAIFLLDAPKENLLLKAHHGFSDEQAAICVSMPRNQCVLGKENLEKGVKVFKSSEHTGCQCQELQPDYQHYCAPILLNEQLEGVIYLNVPLSHTPEPSEIDFLSGVANTLAVIIQRYKLELLKDDLEGQVQQSQRLEAMGTLAGGIAHDFNNILTAIIGFSDISLGMLDKESQPYEFVKQILASGERAKDLVKQILSFSRKGDIVKQPLIITPIIKEAIKLLRASLPANISLNLDYDPNLKSLLGDATQIHQILMNLCTNAFHAVQQSGGTINITLSNITLPSNELTTPVNLPPGQYITIVVTDDGCGIEPTLLTHVFDPYFTTKEKGKGTGLGLSVVHGIARGHGGDIVVESKVGKGSTFSVFLPVLECILPDSGKNENVEEMVHGSESILLVDDEEEVVLITKFLLINLGYKVSSRTSSVEALKAFAHDPDKYDLVISDIAMPKMSGDVLCSKLIAIRPDIPIILCTGFSEVIDEKKAITIGAKKLMRKPIIKQDLAKAVREILDKNS